MLNRKKSPEIKTIEKIDFVKAQKKILKNGIPLYYINGGTQDVLKIDFIFDAGTWFQESKFVASLCNSMLEDGSQNFSSSEIADRFDFYGAYIQLMADQNYGYVSIVTLGKYLNNILEITEDLIKRSTFPNHELEVLIDKNKQKFKLENEKVRTLCQKKFTQVLFGENHPYAITNKIEDFDKIDRNQILEFYKSYYHSGNCRIIIAGLVTDEVLNQFETFFGNNDWANNTIIKPDFEILPDSVKFHHVEKQNGMQSAVRMGKMWVPKTHPDYHALSILITIFGGYFGSRLMTNIREEKGYTYGIGSFILSLKHASYLVVSTEVGNENVDLLINEIKTEMRRLQTEPVSENEIDTVKSYLLGEFLRDFDGPFALAGSFKSINDFGLEYSFYDKYLEVLKTISSADLLELAKKYLDPDDCYIVVAGNKNTD